MFCTVLEAISSAWAELIGLTSITNIKPPQNHIRHTKVLKLKGHKTNRIVVSSYPLLHKIIEMQSSLIISTNLQLGPKADI